MLQLLILLLTFVVTLGASCPTMCTCHHYPRKSMPKTYLYYTSVKCQTLDFDASLDNSTKSLELSHLDEIGLDILTQLMTESDLPFLNQLTIRHSALNNFTNYTDLIGEQINVLSLSFNNLSSTPDLPLNTSSLKSLDLSNNKLTSLRTLPNVEMLNLSANHLSEIGAFQNITELKSLDLSRNNLSQLGNDTFTALTRLLYLNLSHNSLEELHERSFNSLVVLQQLDVSWNRLSCVAPGSLQLPSLSRLLLAGNPSLGKSREVLVGAGGKLQSVDASKTGLKQVPAALTHSIRTLKLADNRIKSVSCGELDTYPLLQLLDLTSNNLVSIEEDALGRLESLTILYLTDNKIENIPRSLPEELSVLHLEFNKIVTVTKDDFEGMQKLEVLLLNDNKITLVEEGAFRHLSSLATLDLSRNPISALPPGSLSGPSALQVLRLAGIETVSPAEDVSFPLPVPDHLITLDLSGSPGLARQLLADTAALAASRELQEVDFSDADLEFVRSDLLHFLTQLRMIHVNGNSLNCSELHWLAAWMRRQDEVEYRDVLCANPPDLWGTRIVDLQPSEVHRPGTTENQNKYLFNWMIHGSSKIVNVNKTLDKYRENDTRNNKSQHITELIKKSTILTTSATSMNPTETLTIKTIETRELIQSTSTETQINHTDLDTGSENKTGKPEQVISFNNTTEIPPNTLTSQQIVARTNNNDDMPLIDGNMTESTSQWNGSTIEMSMYTNNDHQERLLHPGMLILAAGVLCSIVTLTMLVAKFNSRKKRENHNLFQEDIEVASLPSVTELW
ncbi:uncharacterized protein LOC143190227 [Rhynchophorus ferrugineus]|uniref:uncharacterized protein LOC143190227 n=1 Tax=Rhynchophorus ferrugineus TaxID=354439 RepID=UPI003FCE0007